MLAPPPLPRTLAAAMRDVASLKPQTRASAIADLVRHAAGSDGARTQALPLLERALRDDIAMVRSAAAVALADLRAEEALPALLVAVEDKDQHVRQMALSALGEIGDKRAASRLSRALGDERPEVRYQAIIAFARVSKGDPGDVLAALSKALDDEDDAIRYIALRIAEEEELDGDDALADRARALLADKSEKVALAAALYLARRPGVDEAARAVVLRVVSGDLRGTEREDEQAAVELAGEVALSDAVPHLERRAWGLGRFVRDTCAWHAKIALARMGHDRARAELLKDLTSWRREVREAAVVAVGRARLTEAKELLRSMESGSVSPELLIEALTRLELPSRTPALT